MSTKIVEKIIKAPKVVLEYLNYWFTFSGLGLVSSPFTVAKFIEGLSMEFWLMLSAIGLYIVFSEFRRAWDRYNEAERKRWEDYKYVLLRELIERMRNIADKESQINLANLESEVIKVIARKEKVNDELAKEKLSYANLSAHPQSGYTM